MKYIQKSENPPASIRSWLEVQLPVGVNLDYPSFSRRSALRTELIAEQFGLCAYTGAPIDERLDGRADANLSFQAHVEHMKPRSVCQAELEARGGVYGRDLCEDMDYHNLVAALEVKRKPPAKSEIFGAAAHENTELPVKPTHPDCEARFRFDAQGGISGSDAEATKTIELLKLDHPTLRGWRRGAIAGFLPINATITREDVEQLISALATPVEGKLPEFSFCVRGYVESLMSAT